MSQKETFAFQTEAKHVLDMMIHSVYSHKEIFLRELISNASDALDKIRFEALKNPEWSDLTQDLHIRLIPDPENKTLTVEDNGVGMNREEVIEYIGTIAKSGSQEFLRMLQEAKNQDMPPELIGQFGVGFYSSFMVADKVSLVTRRVGEEKAWKWESVGDGEFSLEEAEKDGPGTAITLHLKDADEEDGLEDFTKEWSIRETVRKYSDFVAYPIKMRVERTEVERDEEGKPKEGAEEKKVVTDETLNSMKAIWTRPEKEVTDEEYTEFYKHISHDWSEPLKRISFRAEGRTEFRALLFIPGRAPFDLFMSDPMDRGIQLYIRRVFIMKDCKDLLPEYLRFVKGVVDAEDLSLNVSREILQQNRQIQMIRSNVVRKVLDAIKTMRDQDEEKFKTLWQEFGRVIKEGLFRDAKNREKILEFALFASTHDPNELTNLEEYINRMPEEQDAIYYLTGEDRAVVENSPHLEAFREKGYEVLLLTEPVDEVWLQSVFEYKGKPFKSVGKGQVELGSEEEKKEAEESRKEQEKAYASLLEKMQKILDEHVKEVRLSNRLSQSPACLVTNEQDMPPQLEQLMRASGQEVPKTKRILELNPKHAILETLQKRFEKDPEDSHIADYADLLYGQALLAEGGKLPDTGGFSKRLTDLMTKALEG